MTTSTLSFTVRVAANGFDVRKACGVRAQAYGHHMPAWRESLSQPDAIDQLATTVVLLAEDKASGAAIGTARIQNSRYAPLPIEQCVELPPAIAARGRAEVTRLSAAPGADLLVKIAMWKAIYLYCMASQARWMIAGARNEALIRQYWRLGFRDMCEEMPMVPLPHAGGLLHRVLVLDAYAVERRWLESQHGLYSFFFDTLHPDIDVADRRCVPAQLTALAA